MPGARARQLIALVLTGLLIACAPTEGMRPTSTTGFEAELDAVLVGERPAGPDRLQVVSVTRDGAPLPVQPGLRLQKGDEIATGSDVSAVIVFGDGSRVILWPQTRIRILNPSIQAIVGKVVAIVRDVLEVAAGLEDRFAVRTEYVTAGAAGTAWQVVIERDGAASVIVLDGFVRLSSNQDGWAPVRLGRFQVARTEGPQPPEIGFADPATFNDIVSTINRVTAAGQGAGADLRAPVVAGLPEAEAQRVLAGLQLAVGRRYGVVTGQSPAGIVVDQSPPPGATITPGGAVDLGVEAPSAQVPTLLSLPRERALRTLQDQGLGVGEVTSEFKDGAAAGTVIAQEPGPGDRVPRGMVVDLVVAVDERTYCADHAGPPLENGEILLREGRGQSEIRAVNGTSRAAVVKLRDLSGRTVLSFHVAASNRATVSGAPGGTYRISFATGNGFSRACGRFLEDMSATALDQQLHLQHGGGVEFTLHPVAGGTIKTREMGVDEFLR